MKDILFEDCDIDVLGNPIDFNVDPGVVLGSFGNTTFRNVKVKGRGAIRMQGTADSPLGNVNFTNVSGSVGSDEPVKMKSVRNIGFQSFTVTGGEGKKHKKAVGGKCTW